MSAAAIRATRRRLTQKRIETLIAAAAGIAGARVRIDLVSGEASIDFPAGANDLSAADEEAHRLEAAMSEQMAAGGRKRA